MSTALLPGTEDNTTVGGLVFLREAAEKADLLYGESNSYPGKYWRNIWRGIKKSLFQAEKP